MAVEALYIYQTPTVNRLCEAQEDCHAERRRKEVMVSENINKLVLHQQ